MKILSRYLPGLLLLALSMPAFASHCPSDMKKIDAALAENPALSASDLATVKELRASGEARHKSGDHSGSINDLHQALKMLGLEVR
jgi:hypothetical protein